MNQNTSANLLNERSEKSNYGRQATAAAYCAKCGKPIYSEDEMYTVSDGEYENKCICRECCSELLEENVAFLKGQKIGIILTLVATGIGVLIGILIGVAEKNAIVALIAALWLGSFWSWVRNVISGWWNNPEGRSFAGFIGAFIGAALVAPVITVRNIINGIKNLNYTKKAIEIDSKALAETKEFADTSKAA